MKLERISWGTYLSDIARLIEEVKQIPNISYCKYIYGVPRGGCIPAVMISHALGIPYIEEIDSVEYMYIEADWNEKTDWVLVVDDILDSGKTYLDVKFSIMVDFKFATIYTFKNMEDSEFIYSKKVAESDWLLLPYENASKVEQDFAEYIASRL